MKQIKPIVCKVDFDRIPDYLKKRRQWILWRYEWINDRWSKVPYQSNGQKAKTNNANTWSSYLKIKAAYKADCYDGVGFCFASDDGLAAIDLDHCFESNGQLLPWVKDIIKRFKNTYIEHSPSREVWCTYVKEMA
jgi:putative DNA primase/helicase